MKAGWILLLALLFCFRVTGKAQEASAAATPDSSGIGKMALNGYLSDLFSPQYNNMEGKWKATNYLNQRLNFSWTLSRHLTFTAQLRSRLIYNQAGADTAFFNVHDGLVWQRESSISTPCPTG